MAITDPADVNQLILALQQRRMNIMNALLTDSLSPQPSDSFEGQSVDFDGWRSNLQEQLDKIDDMLGRYNLYEFTHIQI